MNLNKVQFNDRFLCLIQKRNGKSTEQNQTLISSPSSRLLLLPFPIDVHEVMQRGLTDEKL